MFNGTCETKPVLVQALTHRVASWSLVSWEPYCALHSRGERTRGRERGWGAREERRGEEEWGTGNGYGVVGSECKFPKCTKAADWCESIQVRCVASSLLVLCVPEGQVALVARGDQEDLGMGYVAPLAERIGQGEKDKDINMQNVEVTGVWLARPSHRITECLVPWVIKWDGLAGQTKVTKARQEQLDKVM